MESVNAFGEVVQPLRFGLDGTADDPRSRLWVGIRYFIGEQAKWLPAYEHVARWLGDNEGRGLICVGTCGLGKSVICQKVLPPLLKYHFHVESVKVSAIDMNTRIDELLGCCDGRRVIVIDDLGTEAPETVTYGNRRKPFCELVSHAEETATPLVITTNLRTNMQRLKNDCCQGRAGDPDPRRIPSIEERYGVPTLDRLRATTRVVLFTGQSLRA